MEQKNFLLAMGLIAGFLILWSLVVVPRFSPPAAPVATSTDPVKSQTTETQVPEIKSAHIEQGEPLVLNDSILRDENNEIVITPKGGAIRNWRLKLNGKEIDLVLNPEASVLPLATFPDKTFKIALRGRQAVMEATLPSGLHLSKTIALNASNHLHELTFTFTNPSSSPIELDKWSWGWGPGIGTTPDEMKENAAHIRGIGLGKLKVRVLKPGEPQELGRWAALDNRYYLAAFIPTSNQPVQISVDGKKEASLLSLTHNIKVPARGKVTLTYGFYAGPKGYTQLKAYNQGLEESVDFGTFAFIGHPILKTLYYLKTLTGNFGLAIIILTIGIQFLMLPLTVKSFKATLAMKKLQPKIADIQARFKNDPKRLNIEMMNVYKSSGTNPFGGCLPMLLQMPIFLALFTALRNAYELRGAPFYGWIRDLSTPDVLFQIGSFPIHALPLIMGGTMYIQQRMSGSVADPTQRQIMTIMPVMFTFMFYGFPSGLVLYWLTNNLMTMATQWGFQRMNPDHTAVVNTTIVK